jgi:iron(III) transport system ATP-binding protein
VIATEFLGHDVLLTIDPAGDTAPLIVRQHSLNPPAIDAKVRIEVVGTGVALR